MTNVLGGSAWPRSKRWSDAIVRFRHPGELVRDLVGGLHRMQTPSPVAARGSWPIHPRVAAEPEDVLNRNDGQRRDRCEHRPDERPVHVATVESKIVPSD